MHNINFRVSQLCHLSLTCKFHYPVTLPSTDKLRKCINVFLELESFSIPTRHGTEVNIPTYKKKLHQLAKSLSHFFSLSVFLKSPSTEVLFSVRLRHKVLFEFRFNETINQSARNGTRRKKKRKNRDSKHRSRSCVVSSPQSIAAIWGSSYHRVVVPR